MADSSGKSFESAEKAYADAAAEVKPAPAKAPEAPVPASAAVKAEAPKPASPMKKIRKAAPKKAAARQKATPGTRPASSRAEAAPKFAVTSTVSELKEKIMATAKNNDFSKPIADAVGEFQARTKAAYEKGAEVAAEMTEFTKGNVEALVESSKIFAAGAQALGKTYVEEAKTAYETATADVKELAGVKSPTELFQLQGKIARRNFDVFVATSSKNTEAFLKLANEAFAPLTGRVEVATEKLAKVA